MMRSLVWLVLAMPCIASPAFAHAFIERANPPVGASVDISPPELSIQFTEGAAVVTGKPHVAPDNNRRLIIDLPKLPPGTYTVIWHATSVDTHKTEGNYKFTVTH
jgi:methionine-rich copper-binding protein CopC